MSSSTISLQKSIRTCKVDTGQAPRLDSDRFLSQNNLLCPVWTGYDLAGRQVCQDSFYTKSEGCNTANDRIFVENDLRPKYFDYVALNAAGVTGNIYGVDAKKASAIQNVANMKNLATNVGGHFGMEYDAQIRNTACSLDPYQAAADAERARKSTSVYAAYYSHLNRQRSGF